MNKPLISIIIPSYNRALLIGETLDSILAQTYENWECIIVDDGSTDNTAEIIQDYLSSDSRFQFHRRPIDKLKGANACRNFGFTLSKGEFVCWFDSDDIMSKYKLKLSAEYMIENNADLIVCNYSDTNSFDDAILKARKFQSFEFYENYIVDRISILTGDVLFKRDIVANYEFDEKLHKAQEYDFFIQVFQQPLCYIFIESKLWYHRETEDSISASASRMNQKQLNSLIYLSKKIQNNFASNSNIVNAAKRNGRKLYISIVKNNMSQLIFKNYNFFATCFSLTYVELFFWFLYNSLTKRGFDAIKKRANKKI